MLKTISSGRGTSPLQTLLLALFLSLFASLSPAAAYTSGDADTIFNAYNNAFYVGGANAYYKANTGGGRTGFWPIANEIEMVADSYDRTGYTGTRDMITALCNGFLTEYGNDWSWNTFNDDVQWACIAFCRAYLATGNTTFRDRAKSNFDMMYARGWSSALGGGIFWNTSNGSKNACSNGPAIIAACYLYQIYNDSSYLTKAQAIFNWERATLFNATTGAVADAIDLAGNVNTAWIFTYNQGTFVGGGNFLYNLTGNRQFYKDALLATRFMKTNLCNAAGIFPAASDDGSDGSVFNAIGVRWASRFVKDQLLWGEFYPWLKTNADAAWNNRRAGDNLSWCNWTAATAAGTRWSLGCFGSVVALQVIPPSNPTPYFMITSRASGKSVDLAYGSSAEGATVNQWSSIYGGVNQMWALIPTENGDHFKLVNVNTLKCIGISGDSTANGAAIVSVTYNPANTSHQWDLIDAGNGWFKIRNVRSGKILDLDAASSADGAKIQQWTDGGVNHQQWRLQPVGDYFIRTTNGKYICTSGGGNTNGTLIIQYSWEDNPWFKWRFESIGDGLYKISSLHALTRCIAVRFASTTAGELLHLWDYNATYVDEKLTIVPELNGMFKFRFNFNNLFWDIPGNSNANSTSVTQWNNNTFPQQKFILQKVP